MNKCSVDNCNSSIKYKGLCGKHYKRQWRHGDPNKTMIDMTSRICCAQDCTNPANNSYDLCRTHYSRLSRGGHTGLNRRANGAGSVNRDGYRLITIDGKRVYEHIYKAEKALGKALPLKAIVHHWDGNPGNNDNINLVVCPDQAYHLDLHRRMKEAGL
jgi:hypothetical protein